MTHLLRILGHTADGFLIAIHSPPAREREVRTEQALSVTVTVLGNRKSVAVSDSHSIR